MQAKCNRSCTYVHASQIEDLCVHANNFCCNRCTCFTHLTHVPFWLHVRFTNRRSCPFLHRIACYTNLTAYFACIFDARRASQIEDLCDRFVCTRLDLCSTQFDARRGKIFDLCHLRCAHTPNTPLV